MKALGAFGSSTASGSCLFVRALGLLCAICHIGLEWIRMLWLYVSDWIELNHILVGDGVGLD